MGKARGNRSDALARAANAEKTIEANGKAVGVAKSTTLGGDSVHDA
jgi:hypothetical protein